MNDIRKIMVAIGCTKYSQGIYTCGARLAAALDADLIIATVINVRDVDAVRSVASLGYEVDQEHYVHDIREQRKAFIRDIMKKVPFPDERTWVSIRLGNPAEELLKLIVEKEVNMVVMGPKGRTDLEHALVGSVASKLFRRSPVTLVSYRDEEVSEQMKKKIHC